MTICYFGIYSKKYPRNSIIINGLRQNGVEVLECNSRKKGIIKHFSLLYQHNKIKNKYDIMIVGFLGQGIIKLAKKLTSKPIVLDAFVSQYLSNIYDRRLYSEWSFKAKKIRKLEQQACELADLILLDTQAQIKYFIDRYNINKEKFIRVFVGANNKIYFKQKQLQKPDKFIIHWHGYIVPFYAVKTVVQAAELLKDQKDIEFRIVIRKGKQAEKIKNLARRLSLRNIKFYCEKSFSGLAKFINSSDICLGIFGNNQKAKVVIPNKVYEAIACAKPVITANHKVINELFIDNKNIILVKPENPQNLADKILKLKNNPNLKQKIATNGYDLYLKNLLPKDVVKVLIKRLEKF